MVAMDGVDFEVWYRREHSRLVNSVFLLSGSVEVAREAADEAFARAAARWDRVRVMESPGGWVFRVAVNLVRRERRRARRETVAVGRIGGPIEMGDVELPDSQLWAAVRSLPDRQRAAIVLRYVGDLKEAEIAEVLGVSRGTVASNLSRARNALVDALGGPVNREVGQ